MLPKQTAERYLLSSSPHAHGPRTVSSLMLDVIVALLPAFGCAIFFFGLRALLLAGTCIAACLVTEALCRIAMKRENSIGDLSAVLTGLLLALNLPPDLPLWMAAAGGVFAIGICKQAFGGLGYNPFNPALAARAFMVVVRMAGAGRRHHRHPARPRQEGRGRLRLVAGRHHQEPLPRQRERMHRRD